MIPESARLNLLDLSGVSRVAKDAHKVLPFARWSPSRLLHVNATRRADHVALAYEDERITWAEANARANQIAHALRRIGVVRGDVVALYMDNRPDFLLIETAINRIGATSALINTHLTGEPLVHAIRIAGCTRVIVGTEHLERVHEVRDHLPFGATKRYGEALGRNEAQQGSTTQRAGDSQRKGREDANGRFWFTRAPEHRDTLPETKDFSDLFAVADTCPVTCPPVSPPRATEPMAYIYTSGTTGLPKAALITNQRYMLGGIMFGRGMYEADPHDTVYVPLPLYHSSAQWGGWSTALLTGATLALRRKFSATHFWDDVDRFDATLMLYIGELCRYLLNQPEHPKERAHRVRMAAGNGLGRDIWEKFQHRFGVPYIREFYGATEGNAPLFNLDGKAGMVGRMRPGLALLKCDPQTGEPERDARGRCISAQQGETGLLVGHVNAISRFDGYADDKATRKKIIEGVFFKGDRWFNTGDLLTLHENGWLSFADRTGDTFRFKGENVSTGEVARLLNNIDGVLEANVYGVTVPSVDGRAGMAALRVSPDFDLDTFGAKVKSEMPGYMRPYFVRIEEDMQLTGTFKHRKVDYRSEGIDPSKVSAPLYIFSDDRFVPLTKEHYAALTDGRMRL